MWLALLWLTVALAAPPDDLQRQFDEAAKRIRRLPPAAFADMPPRIRKVLDARQCRVPQPEGAPQYRNVIRGEFFEKGQSGWAVLCSVNGFSTILVFRNGTDTKPGELNRVEDRAHLQGLSQGLIGYSRGISPVDRKYIIGHYRAYGGPEPPPIDHHGIDDAFLGKASVVFYNHQGRWLRLQGAD